MNRFNTFISITVIEMSLSWEMDRNVCMCVCVHKRTKCQRAIYSYIPNKTWDAFPLY